MKKMRCYFTALLGLLFISMEVHSAPAPAEAQLELPVPAFTLGKTSISASNTNALTKDLFEFDDDAGTHLPGTEYHSIYRLTWSNYSGSNSGGVTAFFKGDKTYWESGPTVLPLIAIPALNLLVCFNAVPQPSAPTWIKVVTYGGEDVFEGASRKLENFYFDANLNAVVSNSTAGGDFRGDDQCPGNLSYCLTRNESLTIGFLGKKSCKTLSWAYPANIYKLPQELNAQEQGLPSPGTTTTKALKREELLALALHAATGHMNYGILLEPATAGGQQALQAYLESSNEILLRQSDTEYIKIQLPAVTKGAFRTDVVFNPSSGQYALLDVLKTSNGCNFSKKATVTVLDNSGHPIATGVASLPIQKDSRSNRFSLAKYGATFSIVGQDNGEGLVLDLIPTK